MPNHVCPVPGSGIGKPIDIHERDRRFLRNIQEKMCLPVKDRWPSCCWCIWKLILNWQLRLRRIGEGSVRKTLILVMFAMIFLGCTAFGSFVNLKQGESLQTDVRMLLGEPETITYEGQREIWQYRFVKSGRPPSMTDNTTTVLNLSVAFKEKKVENYQVTVSKETTAGTKGRPMGIGSDSPQPGHIGQPEDVHRLPMRGHGDFMADFDKNGDGRVSQEEFDGPVDIFQRFDTNTDGFIDSHEAPKGRAPSQPMGQAGQRAGHGVGPLGDFMTQFDSDADGRVSRKEFTGPAVVFQRMDTNRDGFIDATEAPDN